MRKTQCDRIIEKLKADGEITSAWAFQQIPAILRLSERIREIEEEGWSFEKSFVRDAYGKKTGVYRYVVKDRPVQRKTVWELEIRNGERIRVPRMIET